MLSNLFRTAGHLKKIFEAEGRIHFFMLEGGVGMENFQKILSYSLIFLSFLDAKFSSRPRGV